MDITCSMIFQMSFEDIVAKYSGIMTPADDRVSVLEKACKYADDLHKVSDMTGFETVFHHNNGSFTFSLYFSNFIIEDCNENQLSNLLQLADACGFKSAEDEEESVILSLVFENVFVDV